MTTWVSGRKYATAGVIHPVLVKLWDHAAGLVTSSTNVDVRKAAGLLWLSVCW